MSNHCAGCSRTSQERADYIDHYFGGEPVRLVAFRSGHTGKLHRNQGDPVPETSAQIHVARISPTMVRRTYLAHRKTKELSRAVEAVMDLLVADRGT